MTFSFKIENIEKLRKITNLLKFLSNEVCFQVNIRGVILKTNSVDKSVYTEVNIPTVCLKLKDTEATYTVSVDSDTLHKVINTLESTYTVSHNVIGSLAFDNDIHQYNINTIDDDDYVEPDRDKVYQHTSMIVSADVVRGIKSAISVGDTYTFNNTMTIVSTGPSCDANIVLKLEVEKEVVIGKQLDKFQLNAISKASKLTEKFNVAMSDCLSIKCVSVSDECIITLFIA